MARRSAAGPASCLPSAQTASSLLVRSRAVTVTAHRVPAVSSGGDRERTERGRGALHPPPPSLVKAAGFQIVETERLKAGTVERIHAVNLA
jgi:hypothetical protein